MREKNIYRLLGLSSVVLCWLFIGVIEVAGENKLQRQLFIKRVPTFQLIFVNPYASTLIGEEHEYSLRMDEHGDWLPSTKEFNNYLRYCKYRFGISEPNPLQARVLCKSRDAGD